jgi:hypothetical protein
MGNRLLTLACRYLTAVVARFYYKLMVSPNASLEALRKARQRSTKSPSKFMLDFSIAGFFHFRDCFSSVVSLLNRSLRPFTKVSRFDRYSYTR